VTGAAWRQGLLALGPASSTLTKPPIRSVTTSRRFRISSLTRACSRLCCACASARQ
jgi:hypothetical protein